MGAHRAAGPIAKRCNRSQDAAALVEYALLLALIAVACFVAVNIIGRNASTAFSSIAGATQKSSAQAQPCPSPLPGGGSPGATTTTVAPGAGGSSGCGPSSPSGPPPFNPGGGLPPGALP
jgi:Flp pilus assembly pilin Flp